MIVGPDGAPWVTDGGLNAIVRVDPATLEVKRFPLPASSGYANLNTATFDRDGVLWFTGQSGIYGRLDPETGALRVFRAPGGTGPYGITTTPRGRRLVRVARRKPHRPDRPSDGQGDRRAPADAGSGRAAHLVGLARTALGERVECRQARTLRPRHEALARVARCPDPRSRTPSTSTTATSSG